MQHDKYAARQRCSAPMIQHTIDASHHICSSSKMHPAKDAAYLRFTIPKIHHTKDASHQRYNALKMQFTKESPYQRCIAPDMHPTKDIIYQRCTKIVQMASGRPLGSKFGQKCPKKRQRMAKIHFLGGIGESVCCHHVWIPTRHLFALIMLHR